MMGEQNHDDHPDHPHGTPPGQDPDFVPPGHGGTPPGQAPEPAHPIAEPEEPEDVPDPEPKESRMADEVTPQQELSALDLGAVAYAAFSDTVHGTDANGVPLPDFAHLHEQYRQAWVAGALAACAAHVAAQPPPVPASAPEGKASPSETDEPDKTETTGYRRGRR